MLKTWEELELHFGVDKENQLEDLDNDIYPYDEMGDLGDPGHVRFIQLINDLGGSDIIERSEIDPDEGIVSTVIKTEEEMQIFLSAVMMHHK